jgi:hypothetical protein
MWTILGMRRSQYLLVWPSFFLNAAKYIYIYRPLTSYDMVSIVLVREAAPKT